MLKGLHSAYTALAIIKAQNAEGYERRRFGRVNRRLFAEQMAMRQARALSSPVIEMLAMVGVMGTATIAAWYFFKQGVGADRFMAVLFALAAAGASLKPITQVHTQIKEADAAAGRVLGVLRLPQEPVHHRTRRSLPQLARHTREIRYEGVRFAYPGADVDALRQVDFAVPFGRTTAIVGANGSGKTTLLSLLPRLREPRAGRVFIDDVDIADVNLRSLREQISVVTQQTILFEGTIAENIAYARPTTPIGRIVEAARLASAHEFIVQLPQGYDTALGEGGEGLSGGQRQRLAIARAVLNDPTILILDEATSQIDAESEAKINQALRNVRRGRTTFVIAHRLSTVREAGLILVLQDGEIVERGSHEELIASPGIYRDIYQLQLLPQEEIMLDAAVARDSGGDS
jgi:ABC-type multidrug transport system fused ATPase/permease subunit